MSQANLRKAALRAYFPVSHGKQALAKTIGKAIGKQLEKTPARLGAGIAAAFFAR